MCSIRVTILQMFQNDHIKDILNFQIKSCFICLFYCKVKKCNTMAEGRMSANTNMYLTFYDSFPTKKNNQLSSVKGEL